MKDPNKWIDYFGLDCVDQALKSVKQQLKQRRKEISVKVNSKTDAEDFLRAYISDNYFKHPGAFMNTTVKGTFSPQKAASDWLPRPSSRKRGTYHWDKYDPNAAKGDHALKGDHLQIHDFKGRIIRVFY